MPVSAQEQRGPDFAARPKSTGRISPGSVLFILGIHRVEPLSKSIPSWFEFSGVRASLAALVGRVLRVDGSGMKSHCASAPVPLEQLKPVRHGKIERMNPRQPRVEQKVTKGTKKKFPVLVCFVSFCKSFCLFSSSRFVQGDGDAQTQGFQNSLQCGQRGIAFYFGLAGLS
jgi:hypothetical protein